MSAKDYEETWVEIDDEALIDRIKLAFVGTKDNQFVPYDFYRVKDTINPDRFHYIVRIYGGKNGCGEWTSYLEDMCKIFEALLDRNKCSFSDAWLIEWKNSCANDTSMALIGLRDENQ